LAESGAAEYRRATPATKMEGYKPPPHWELDCGAFVEVF